MGEGSPQTAFVLHTYAGLVVWQNALGSVNLCGHDTIFWVGMQGWTPLHIALFPKTHIKDLVDWTWANRKYLCDLNKREQ